jgi:hypothetical protein
MVGGIVRRQTIAGARPAMSGRSFSNNKSPQGRARGSSAIGGGLSNLREVEDELDDDRFDN